MIPEAQWPPAVPPPAAVHSQVRPVPWAPGRSHGVLGRAASMGFRPVGRDQFHPMHFFTSPFFDLNFYEILCSSWKRQGRAEKPAAAVPAGAAHGQVRLVLAAVSGSAVLVRRGRTPTAVPSHSPPLRGVASICSDP